MFGYRREFLVGEADDVTGYDVLVGDAPAEQQRSVVGQRDPHTPRQEGSQWEFFVFGHAERRVRGWTDLQGDFLFDEEIYGFAVVHGFQAVADAFGVEFVDAFPDVPGAFVESAVRDDHPGGG